MVSPHVPRLITLEEVDEHALLAVAPETVL